MSQATGDKTINEKIVFCALVTLIVYTEISQFTVNVQCIIILINCLQSDVLIMILLLC